MGLDYRYLLFFEGAAQLDVLRHIAAMAVGGSETTIEVPVAESGGVEASAAERARGAGPAPDGLPQFPYRTLTLPLKAWAGTPSRLWWDDPSPRWEFAASLGFEPDSAIEQYGRAGLQLDDSGRAAIGYIYLTLHRGMADWASGVDRDVVLLELGTPGSSMSVLFLESESIRAAMVGLLAACRGVCGLLDMEDSAILFWWRGRELDETLPTAELDLAEIERFVPPAH